MKKEYTLFLTSIKRMGESSIVELENLLTDLEALSMQMAKASILKKEGEGLLEEGATTITRIGREIIRRRS